MSKNGYSRSFCLWKKYNESTFSILRKSFNYFDVIKLETTLIKLLKPKLCKQKHFDHTVALSSYAILVNLTCNLLISF